MCEKLAISALIIPPGAGVGSAIGFLKAPFSFEATRGLFQRLDGFDANLVNAALKEMESEANTFVDEGAAGVARETKLTALMRYSGQGWEIPVPLPHRAFEDGDVPVIKDAFEEAYQTLFGRTIDGLAIEITNWLLSVSTILPPAKAAATHGTGNPADVIRTRQFYDAALRKSVDAREVDRASLTPGKMVEGPAVIVESETTTIVTSGYSAIGQGDGSILLVRKVLKEAAA